MAAAQALADEVAAQFRPPGPPALNSETWARDFNEVKALGGRASTRRSAEQTEVARFWDYSAPPIYHALVRSVALQPGRSLERNARLFAAVAQAMDDALIAVFDAKYHHQFWRPITAIRNADIDGNDATEREAGWLPLIDVPMHPEYPAAHSVLAAAMGSVLAAEVGDAANASAHDIEPTAKGVGPTLPKHRWARSGSWQRAHLGRRALPHRDRGRNTVGSAGRAVGGCVAAPTATAPSIHDSLSLHNIHCHHYLFMVETPAARARQGPSPRWQSGLRARPWHLETLRQDVRPRA